MIRCEAPGLKAILGSMGRLAIYVAVAVWSALPVALGQSAGFTPRKDLDRIPSYDVVSIHKVASGTVGRSIHDEADGLTARDVTLRSLIAEAYGFSLGDLRDQQLIGAPAWAGTQLFDIRAKVDSADVAKLKALTEAATMMVEVRQMVSRTPTLRMVMLQRLLEDRFHLKVHYEQKVMPLYELTVAKGGVRMKAAQSTDPNHGSMSMDAGKVQGENAPMAFIPVILALVLERPVEDKTGVEGNYDFEMHWTPMTGTQANDSDESLPSLFTAVQEQMGLKLKAGRGPVWVVVVDHAEMPSEN